MSPNRSGHQHTPEEERRIRDAALDQTIENSFPASDPPSSTPNPDDHAAVDRAPQANDRVRPVGAPTDSADTKGRDR
jgi:hypothetical protein